MYSVNVFDELFRSNEIVAVVDGHCYESSDEQSSHHLWIGRSKIYLQQCESINTLVKQYFASSVAETTALQKKMLEQEAFSETPLEHFIFADFLEKDIRFEIKAPSIPNILDSIGPQELGNYLLIDEDIYRIRRKDAGQLVIHGQEYELDSKAITTSSPNYEYTVGLRNSIKKASGSDSKILFEEADDFRRSKQIRHSHYVVSCDRNSVFFERNIPAFISRLKGAYYHFPKLTIRSTATLQQSNEVLSLERIICAKPNTYVHPFVYRKLSGEICNRHKMPWDEQPTLRAQQLTYALGNKQERKKAALFIQTFLHMGYKTITQGYPSNKAVLPANPDALQRSTLVGYSTSQAEAYARRHNICEGDIFHG